MCLPGKSAWDIDYFLNSGKFTRVVGIERDGDIAQHLRDRYREDGRVEIFEGTVGRYLMGVSYPLDLVYLDYCSPFGLAQAQDIQILLQRGVLSHGARCIVSFFNARETEATQIAQRRLFDELNLEAPPGEVWEDVEPNRRRCIAFNALLHRHRRRGKLWRIERPLIAPSAVSHWHQYATTGGAMLTGYFLMRLPRTKVPENAAKKSPDKWFVRGKSSLKIVAEPSSLVSISYADSLCGRDLSKDRLVRGIVDYYRKTGKSPRRREVTGGGKHRHKWNNLIRELGLCPVLRATVDDVKGELRRIHEKEGILTIPLLLRADLICMPRPGLPEVGRGSIRTAYGGGISAYCTLLDEMEIPHDLRLSTERRQHSDLAEWVNHLECGKVRSHSPHYQKMQQRGLLIYGDAVRELRRVRKKYHVS
tara:strand:- start:380 stop:1639 length:1260 start_codon:yes stop_codon:yes gene_type:complete